MTGQRIKYKKFLIFVEALNRYEKKKDRAVSFLENDSEKYLKSVGSGTRLIKPSTKLLLASREPLLYLEFNKPNKLNVYEINLFEKLNSELPKKIHASPGISKSTERRPRVPKYQSAVLSAIADPLQLALLPEPASRARDAQKVAQYVFPL